MKKYIFFFFISLILIASFGNINIAQAVNPNLIPNPSVETTDSNNIYLPATWHTNNWGTNTASFAWALGGYDGLRSLMVQVQSYSSGDAKWYFDPVTVKPSATYIFSDYYISTALTELDAQITNTSGNVSYQYIGAVPKSNAWNKVIYQFTTPADAAQISIFHVIYSVGTLQTDNFSLKEPEAPPVQTDIVPNNSLEQVNELTGAPLNWQTNDWGNNKASFTYLNYGHSGSRAVQTTVTTYTDGDAKWFFDPQPLAPNTNYQFTDWYICNNISRIVLQITHNDGSLEYQGLRTADPATSWTKYTDNFTTPADIKALTVFHLLAGVGTLTTDDYSIQLHNPLPLNRPLVTLTFDDGWEENITSAIPLIDQYGDKVTYFFATTYIEHGGRNAPSIIKSIAAHGEEIGSHSVTHPFLTQVSDTQLTYELTHSKQYLESLVGVGKVKCFATPYGDYDGRVVTAIKKYYSCNRNTDAGYNGKETIDPYNIRVQNMTSTTTLAEYNSWLAQAKTDKTWLVIVYHVVTNTPDTYDVTPQNFSAQLAALKTSGLTELPMSQALAEINAQK